MLRKILSKLLGMNKHNGSHYRPFRSSDDYRKQQQYRNNYNNQHNQYGHSHYRKKRSSSSYSS